MKNAIIAHVGSYNHRRFSAPWVCKMESNGDHNFDDRIGIFTGDRNCGSAGDLVIFAPVVDQVYGYGQKDYRGKRTLKSYARWDGEKFVPCDKLGRAIA